MRRQVAKTMIGSGLEICLAIYCGGVKDDTKRHDNKQDGEVDGAGEEEDDDWPLWVERWEESMKAGAGW